MAAVLAQQLRFKVHSPRSLMSTSKRLFFSTHQHPARLKHRPSTILAVRQPTRICLHNQRFMASTNCHERLESLSADEFEHLSVERKIRFNLAAGEKWGWVIYRCSYKPELQSSWENFKHFVDKTTRKEIAESDAPDIAQSLDWVFVEDPELEGASLDELKHKFRAWVRSEAQGKYNKHYVSKSSPFRVARHKYFIQADEDALRSLLRGPSYGYVNMVRGWEDPLPPEEATDQFGDAIDIEDWMRIQADMIEHDFYYEMEGGEEYWYLHYQQPPHNICNR
ncbi:hypothetical protein V8C42DRAFT_310617 [Trichoderma barbatum]